MPLRTSILLRLGASLSLRTRSSGSLARDSETLASRDSILRTVLKLYPVRDCKDCALASKVFGLRLEAFS